MVLDTLLEVLDYVLDVDAKLVGGVELQGAVSRHSVAMVVSAGTRPVAGDLAHPQRQQGQRQRGSTHQQGRPA